MNEEIKRDLEKEIKENGVQDIAYYDVYKTSNGLYLTEDICNIYHVGNREIEKEIKGNHCFRVTDADLNEIRNQSVNQEIALFPNIITIFDLKLVLTFDVLVDINHNNQFYVLSTLCNKYGIYPIEKRIIDGFTYCQVTEADLDAIEKASEAEKIRLSRKFITITLEDVIKPAEYLFIYYYDPNTNKSYVNREMLELIQKNKIEIEAEPKIINGKNGYSITEEQLKEVEDKMGYRGVEQLLKPKANQTKPNLNYPSKDIINSIVENITNFKQHQKEKFNQLRENNALNAQEVTVPSDTILVYRNPKTEQYFVPADEFPESTRETTMVMNKYCYETTMAEIENATDKKIVIADVYPTEAEALDVIICDYKGELYVAKDILDQLGFYIEEPHKIMVNGLIYEEITEEDIEKIKAKNPKCINIVMKHITPKRG